MTGLSRKILVITSCTRKKAFEIPNSLEQNDFTDRELLWQKENRLAPYRLPAAYMYTGRQHLLLMEGLTLLRRHYGPQAADLKIVSAGYGLIDETTPIVPYNITFSNMKVSQINEWSAFLGIREQLAEALQQGYDLVFFLLGSNYLRALSLPVPASEEQQLIFITGWKSSSLIPSLENYHLVGTEQKDAASFGCPQVSLKGMLFKLFCGELTEDPALLERVYEDPDYLHYVFYRHRTEARANLFCPGGVPPFPEIKSAVSEKKEQHRRRFTGYIVRDREFAANYRAGKSINYFIPDWDDRVDPMYDFINDKHNRGEKNAYEHDWYAHEIFPNPNYDGILVSLAVLDNGKREMINRKGGIHSFLRFPDQYPVMADCGAFNYVGMDEPPFKTAEVLQSYEQLGFSYGVSIDHLIVGDFLRDTRQRNRRYELTQKNAQEFIELYQAGNYSFTPIGVAQGWHPASYRDSVRALIDLGYEYVALGSLVSKTSHQIYEIMKAVAPILPEYMDLHLFGVTRPEGIKSFHQLGATSFDSSGPLRQAWLSASSNYHTMERIDGASDYNSYKKYAAVRIPFINPKHLPDNLVIELRELEQAALAAVRMLGKKQANVDQVVETVMAYEEKHHQANFIRLEKKLEQKLEEEHRETAVLDLQKLSKKREQAIKQIQLHRRLYREVLERRPWEDCNCQICREIGIEVIIFRGNNRNRRRGFHNTYVFNKLFRNAIQRKELL